MSARRDRRPGSPLNVPPIPASNFVLGDRRAYSRDDGTPTWEALEEITGWLEGGSSIAFASGMVLAERRERHPNITLTRYPGLAIATPGLETSSEGRQTAQRVRFFALCRAARHSSASTPPVISGTCGHPSRSRSARMAYEDVHAPACPAGTP